MSSKIDESKKQFVPKIVEKRWNHRLEQDIFSSWQNENLYKFNARSRLHLNRFHVVPPRPIQTLYYKIRDASFLVALKAYLVRFDKTCLRGGVMFGRQGRRSYQASGMNILVNQRL